MKMLMIIAKNDFRDEEFQIPFNHFQEKQIVVDVASTEKGDCFGKLGAVVSADLALKDVEIEQYFAIVLVGGPGASGLVGDKEIERILHEAEKQDIVISAICIAPLILAHAGILEGKKATVWDEDKNQNPVLFEYGADYVKRDVVVDGRVITANGPHAAQEFAEEIVKVLECDDCHIK